MTGSMTIEQMRRLVAANGTGWEWEDSDRRRGFITTQQGRWSWDDTADAYVMTDRSGNTKR